MGIYLSHQRHLYEPIDSASRNRRVLQTTSDLGYDIEDVNVDQRHTNRFTEEEQDMEIGERGNVPTLVSARSTSANHHSNNTNSSNNNRHITAPMNGIRSNHSSPSPSSTMLYNTRLIPLVLRQEREEEHILPTFPTSAITMGNMMAELTSLDEHSDDEYEDSIASTKLIINRSSFRWFLATCLFVIVIILLIYFVVVFVLKKVPPAFQFSPTLLFIEAASDALIALAYFIIPFFLVFLVKYRRDLPFNWIFLMFSGFILSCGMTHLVNTFGPWIHPHPHVFSQERSFWFTVLSGAVKVFTAIISLVTAIAGFALLPLALKLPSPKRLRKEITIRRMAEYKLQKQYERSLLISSITTKIRNSFHTQDIFQIAAIQIGSAMRASRCTIHRYQRNSTLEKAKIPCESEYLHPNYPSESFLNVDLPITGFLTKILANSEALHVHIRDMYSEDEEDRRVVDILSSYDVHSMICIRTSYQGSPNGLIMLHRCSGNHTKWALEDYIFVKELAAQLGIALQQTYLLEQERKRYQLELQNIKLEKARDLAEKENKAKSEFLAIMSHECRTPCNAIIGMNTLLQKSELTKEQQECVKIIEDSSNLLVAIINSFLDFSKLESGKIELEFKQFNLCQAIENSVNMFTLNAKQEKNIEVKAIVRPDVPSIVIGDKFRLQQVLINLLSNGVKFTENGGRVTVEVQVLSKNASETLIQFSVSDTGIGIPESQIDRLFQPFSQVHSSGMSRRFGGTGLGLSICKKLCELMGGSIWVTSKPGCGSNFYFTIKFGTCNDLRAPSPVQPSTTYNAPVIRITADSSALPSFKTNYSSSIRVDPQLPPTTTNFGSRILMAEDNIINQKVAVSLLKKLGYDRVDVVSNGKLAVDAVVRENLGKKGKEGYDPYICVLMDLMMPEMDGIEATSQIRNMTRNEQTQIPFIIALTANVQQDIQQRCKEVGFDDFLSKPFKLEQLGAVLQKHTSNTR